MTTTIPSLTLVRRIKAPPARVFAAWTRPDMLAQWFGPHHTRVLHAEVDARIDGRFLVEMQEVDGTRHGVGGRYLVIDLDREISFTWAWVSMPERESRVTVRFRPLGEETEITLTHDRFADGATATRHRRGWTESMQRLDILFTWGSNPTMEMTITEARRPAAARGTQGA